MTDSKPVTLGNGAFVFSVDLGLAWGFVGNPSDPAFGRLCQNPEAVRGGVSLLVRLLEQYRIPATWAVVGHAMLDHCDRQQGVAHPNMPRFLPGWYDLDPCDDWRSSPLWYGPDILESILSSGCAHEIGYHTFSHVPFGRCSREVAKAELREGVELGRSLGIQFRSIVFPEDSVGHTDLLKEYGFTNYRSGRSRLRPDAPRALKRLENARHKLIADPSRPVLRDGLWDFPSSMYFYDHRYRFTLLGRARRGIHRAIRDHMLFHAWVHPHDLVFSPRVLESLGQLLALVSAKRDEGHLTVQTMGDLADRLFREPDCGKE